MKQQVDHVVLPNERTRGMKGCFIGRVVQVEHDGMKLQVLLATKCFECLPKKNPCGGHTLSISLDNQAV